MMASCNAKREKAKEFISEITNTNDSVYVAIKNVGNAINRGFLTSDYSNVKPARIEMEQYVQRKIRYFKNLNPIDDLLLRKEKSYLEFELSVINEHFLKLENVSLVSTET